MTRAVVLEKNISYFLGTFERWFVHCLGNVRKGSVLEKNISPPSLRTVARWLIEVWLRWAPWNDTFLYLFCTIRMMDAKFEEKNVSPFLAFIFWVYRRYFDLDLRKLDGFSRFFCFYWAFILAPKVFWFDRWLSRSPLAFVTLMVPFCAPKVFWFEP